MSNHHVTSINKVVHTNGGDNHSQNAAMEDELDGVTTLNAKQVLEIVHEMSGILDTHLDLETLALCFRLIENGVNAEALAQIIMTMKNQYQSKQHNHNNH